MWVGKFEHKRFGAPDHCDDHGSEPRPRTGGVVVEAQSPIAQALIDPGRQGIKPRAPRGRARVPPDQVFGCNRAAHRSAAYAIPVVPSRLPMANVVARASAPPNTTRSEARVREPPPIHAP